MKSKMNVIVTGGTSFIGLEVISRLIKLDCRIWAIVRPESANRSKLPDHKNLNIIEKSLDELDTLTVGSSLLISTVEACTQAENETRSANIKWGIKQKVQK